MSTNLIHNMYCETSLVALVDLMTYTHSGRPFKVIEFTICMTLYDQELGS